MANGIQIERRAAQRFSAQVPVSFCVANDGKESRGLTQDVSASGAMLLTERRLDENAHVELIFVMPSEITFDGNSKVRCQGKVLRVTPPQIGTNYGTAVHFEHYEFLAEKNTVSYAPILQEQDREELSLSSHVFQPRSPLSY
jgi:c-di-GMP-binding flagellar brake protein YcgR